MANTVILKRSGTASSAPTSLAHGELAINYADGKVFWKNSSNTISSFTLADEVLEYATTGDFPATGDPSYIYIASDESRMFRWVGAWVEIGPSASSEEVIEATTVAGFPATGNTSALYVATDTSRFYRWTGSVYVEVGPSASYAAANSIDGGSATTFDEQSIDGGSATTV